MTDCIKGIECADILCKLNHPNGYNRKIQCNICNRITDHYLFEDFSTGVEQFKCNVCEPLKYTSNNICVMA